MRLLIVTQKVNREDPILGFFHDWISEFAKHAEQVTVVCLEKGLYKLPENVSVYSLGKEQGKSKLSWMLNFFRLICSLRKQYDVVFVHMNPIYIVLGGILWKLLGKKIFLWYTHKSVDLKLRLAERLVDVIFTASKDSFRMPSKKLVVTGHGIDTEVFKPNFNKTENSKFKILCVGRISKIKGQHLIIEAVKLLKDHGILTRLEIIGSPTDKDGKRYVSTLEDQIDKNKLRREVRFIGPVTNSQVVAYLGGADVLVNASDTGSLDKVILESLACETFAISSNDSAKEILLPLNSHFIFEKNNARHLAEQLIYIYENRMDMHYVKQDMRKLVVENHNLSMLIEKISNYLKR